jgi:four helix bundle protein
LIPNPIGSSVIGHRSSVIGHRLIGRRASAYRVRAVLSHSGMAKRLDELPVYNKALAFCDAVSAILGSPGLRRDWKLRNQISDASDSITANIEEGFEQGTDRAFARYLTISKGSLAETLGHLRRARKKKYLSNAEVAAAATQGETLGRMLGGFIKYLHRCDWKDRGHHLDDRSDDEHRSDGER